MYPTSCDFLDKSFNDLLILTSSMHIQLDELITYLRWANLDKMFSCISPPKVTDVNSYEIKTGHVIKYSQFV